MNKQKRRNQKGFTLIEIIAVLIILGVLAAVAVPKYIDLTTDAKHAAAQAGVAEGMARLSQGYAKALLTGSGTVTGGVTAVMGAADTDAGDFTLSYAFGTGSNVTVTATGKTGTSVDGGTGSGTWTAPQ